MRTLAPAGAVALAGLVLLGGCFSIESKKTRFYSLQPVPGARVAHEDVGAPIGIDAVELPPALESEEMVVYLAPYRVEVRGLDRWAAPLDAMVPRVLGSNLANRLPEGRVVLSGQVRPAGPMRSLGIAVERFAPGPDPTVVLEARWTLGPTDGSRAAVPHRERIVVDLASTDGDAVAAAMSTALGRLADRIVAALAREGPRVEK